MAKKRKLPRTPALRVLDQAGVAYTVYTYDYVERGGTGASSAAQPAVATANSRSNAPVRSAATSSALRLSMR